MSGTTLHGHHCLRPGMIADAPDMIGLRTAKDPRNAHRFEFDRTTGAPRAAAHQAEPADDAISGVRPSTTAEDVTSSPC